MIYRATIESFITRLEAAFGRPGSLYVAGEATPVLEGWSRWTELLTYTADIEPEDRTDFARAVDEAQAALDIPVLEESPADVIPLPDGYMARCRPARFGNREIRHLQVYHFDPYSVAFRYIARGDEPDYHLVLAFLKQGWIEMDEMNRLLAELLPRFTCENIQQDPAEFRRKYKGLCQMWHAQQSNKIHPGIPVTTLPS